MWTFSHFKSHWKRIDSNPRMSFMLHLLSILRKLFILTRKSNDFKLKIKESLLIARDKPVLNKGASSLLLGFFKYNISGYHMMFYHIIWCQFILFCVYNCGLFSFLYYVTSFVFYQLYLLIKSLTFDILCDSFLIPSWFNATVAAYWEHLLSF